MAIITCPECGKEISSNANLCPNCGYSFQKKRRTILVWKVLFCIANFLYLGRLLNLRMILATDEGELFWHYLENREIDGSSAFDWLSPLEFAAEIAPSIFNIIIAMMYVAFFVSMFLIVKNKYPASIISFSAIPLLLELFFILANDTEIDNLVKVSTYPFELSTLIYIFLGVVILIIELLVYKKVIQPLINKTINPVKQPGSEIDAINESGV